MVLFHESTINFSIYQEMAVTMLCLPACRGKKAVAVSATDAATARFRGKENKIIVHVMPKITKYN